MGMTVRKINDDKYELNGVQGNLALQGKAVCWGGGWWLEYTEPSGGSIPGGPGFVYCYTLDGCKQYLAERIDFWVKSGEPHAMLDIKKQDKQYRITAVCGATKVKARVYRTETHGWYIEQSGKIQRAEPTLSAVNQILANRAIINERIRVAG